MSLSNVYFLAHDEHWGTPPEAGPPETWAVGDRCGDGFRRMGRWRLLFEAEFSIRLGYRYLWQMDGDLHVDSPIDLNLMQHLKKNQV